MAQFKDKHGRPWNVEINTTAIKRVKSIAGVDLLNLTEEYGLFTRVLADPIQLVDVLYAVCEPQCREQGVTDEQFGEGMVGDVINEATQRLLDEVIGFFPNARQRANLTAIRQKAEAFVEKSMDAVEARINSGEIEREAQLELDRAMARFGGPSTGSPASSESTPGP